MNDIECLSFITNCKNELLASNSNIKKQEVLLKYYDLDKNIFTLFMNLIFSYKFKYYITSVNILKKNDILVDENIYKTIGKSIDEITIFEVLDLLSTRKFTGNNAIGLVNSYIKNRQNYKDIILQIIDKDIKARVDAKTINKVIPNLIPTFDVSLGEKFVESRLGNNDWFISRKIDGCRCIGFKNSVQFFSRQGEEFWTTELLGGILKDLPIPENIVFDGELSLINEDNSDNFQGIMKEIRKKNHVIQKIRYNVFDILTTEEFENKTSTRKFSERYNELLKYKEVLEATGHFKIVEQVPFTEQTFKEYQQKVVENNWEGLMLRKDATYQGRRTFDLMKYKNFFDDEYVVEDVLKGVKPMLVNNVMKNMDCVSALIINHKGFKVNVGSGLSDSQRLEWFKNPSVIIGKTITVKYFEETTDQNGNLSLRFPTLKFVFDKEGRKV